MLVVGTRDKMLGGRPEIREEWFRSIAPRSVSFVALVGVLCVDQGVSLCMFLLRAISLLQVYATLALSQMLDSIVCDRG